jgi:hypothetical protein
MGLDLNSQTSLEDLENVEVAPVEVAVETETLSVTEEVVETPLIQNEIGD